MMLLTKMIIKGKRIYIKSGIKKLNYPTLLSWYQDLEIVGNLRRAKEMSKFKRISDVENYIKESIREKKTRFFEIHDSSEKELIGYILLANLNKNNCEYGIIIGNKKYWGKGIGTETTRLALDYCFKQLKLKEVFVTTSTHNTRAQSLNKKIGFHIIKTVPNDRTIFDNGKWKRAGTIFMKIAS